MGIRVVVDAWRPFIVLMNWSAPLGQYVHMLTERAPPAGGVGPGGEGAPQLAASTTLHVDEVLQAGGTAWPQGETPLPFPAAWQTPAAGHQMQGLPFGLTWPAHPPQPCPESERQ